MIEDFLGNMSIQEFRERCKLNKGHEKWCGYPWRICECKDEETIKLYYENQDDREIPEEDLVQSGFRNVGDEDE